MILLLILLFIIIFTAKNAYIRKQNLKKLFFVILGAFSLYIFIRIIPPLFALISSLLIALIPFYNSFARILSLISIIIPFIKNKDSIKREKNTMSKQEACDILEVDFFASEQEIKEAFRKKIKENHPDKGGSSYMADKITEAKNILLKTRQTK